MTLHPLEGHEVVRRALGGASERGQLPSTLLFHGPRGVGKQRLALWVAQLLLCDGPSVGGLPCGACPQCRAVLGLAHADLHWHFPLARPTGSLSPDRLAAALEKARWDVLAETREQPVRAPHEPDGPFGIYLAAAQTIRRAAVTRPSVGARQVFVIGEAQLLASQGASQEAANALLKLLEEPGERTTFILTSSEPGRLLDTIRSRAVSIHIAPLPTDAVAAFLAAHRELSPEEAGRAARLGRGSIGRALGFLGDGEDRGPLEELRRDAFKLLRASLAGSRGTAYRFALGKSARGGRELAPLFDALEDWVRDAAALIAGAGHLAINSDALDAVRKLVESSGLTATGAAAALEAVHGARSAADGNAHPQLVLFELADQIHASVTPGQTSVAVGATERPSGIPISPMTP